MPRDLKRYKNRKLYDPQESRYVTLAEIVEWIHEGTSIRVVEASSGEDVTAQILAAVISEQVRGASRPPAADRLHEIVRALGTRASKLHAHVKDSVQHARDRLRGHASTSAQIGRLSERLEDVERRLATIEGERELARSTESRAAKSPRKSARRRSSRKNPSASS